MNQSVDCFTKDNLDQENHGPVAVFVAVSGLALANKTSLLSYFIKLFHVLAEYVYITMLSA